MKKLIITTFLLTLSVLSYAEDRPSEPAFCEWLGEAASSVAVSRDNGVEENDRTHMFASPTPAKKKQMPDLPQDPAMASKRGMQYVLKHLNTHFVYMCLTAGGGGSKPRRQRETD